jgi:predicted MFS family arabinose efflux permease
VAVAGFLLAAGAILPATFTATATVSVWYTCLAVFGLETTVGVSWAIPLDIGGDYAGSVSSVMNTCGNIGGAVSATVLGYLVQSYGWNVPFVVASALCVTAAALFGGIDATRKIFADERR